MADEFIQEINEELQAQRLRAIARRVGAVVVGVVIIAAIGAGIWGWQAHTLHVAQKKASARYMEGVQLLDKPETNDPKHQQADAIFSDLAAHAPQGVKSYAAMALAESKQRNGDLSSALTLWKQIAQDKASDPALRDMARYLSLNAQMDTASPEMLRQGYQELVQSGGSWASLAREGLAVLDMRPGSTAAQHDEARRLLKQVQSSPDSTGALRDRAGLLLQTLGDAG